MRIVFMGTPEFAVKSLDILIKNHYEIPAVVTAPDRPRGRGQQLTVSATKKFALEKRLRVLQPEKLKDSQFVAAIEKIQPDLIVVVAFRILPREVFVIPKYGAFNLHASLLPKYRGAAPIHWAIINGESETGVTSFFLQDAVDTGSMILQERTSIGENETVGELHDKLSNLGAKIVLETVRLIESGKVQTHVQDESSASPAPKIFTEDCRIRWDSPSREIHNFIRGLSPHPCAWTIHKGKILKIFRAVPIEKLSIETGRVIEKSTRQLLIGTKNGSISVLEIQQEGRSRLGIQEFLRGYSIVAGDKFE